MFGTFALSVGAAVSAIILCIEKMFGTFALSENVFSGGNGVLGEMGAQSVVARFLVAHARGI